MTKIICFNCNQQLAIQDTFSEEVIIHEGKFTCESCVKQIDPRMDNLKKLRIITPQKNWGLTLVRFSLHHYGSFSMEVSGRG